MWYKEKTYIQDEDAVSDLPEANAAGSSKTDFDIDGAGAPA